MVVSGTLHRSVELVFEIKYISRLKLYLYKKLTQGGPPLLSQRGRPSISIFSLENLLFRDFVSSPIAEYIECNAHIERFSVYRQSICLSYDKLDILLRNSIYKSKDLFDIFC